MTASDGGRASPLVDGSADAGLDGGFDASAAFVASTMTPGARLHGMYFETTDGLSSLAGIYDTQLNVECAWARAADGSLRCLPAANALATSAYGLTFTDSSCTVPFDATDCSPGTKAYAEAAVRTCPSGSRVFAVGGAIANPTTIYILLADGTCSADGTPSTGQAYAMTEVGEAAFVGGTETTTGVGALAAVTVAGNDGSMSFRTLHDRTNDVDCAFGLATDSAPRCLPSTGATISDYADSKCTVPAGAGPLSTCASFAYALGAPTGCPSTTPVYALGGKVSQLFTGTPASCAAEAVEGADFYASGGLLPPAMFVAGTAGTEATGAASTARLSRMTVSSKDATVFADGGFGASFHDAMRSEDCFPLVAADGKLRCLPVPKNDVTSEAALSSGGIKLYADAACSVPAAIGQSSPCTKPKYAFDLAQAATCATQAFAIYPITGPLTGNIHAKQGGTCVSAPVPAGQTGYIVGAEIPASSFVAITTTVH